jgi:ABC-2 type transport system ATP-binding protein
MSGPAVEAEGLAKSFGAVHAVDGLSFSVEPGQVVGLLGPNGAGKTTTVRMLVGLIRPNKGESRLLGEKIKPGAKVLERVGALVEKPAFVPYLSGLENLGDAVHRKTRGYSQGMRQRLGIAQALLNQPDLLILDEPTNGLDPAETRRLRGAIRTIADRGTTILVSSHILAEVEQVCTHALVIDHGKLVAQGTVADLVGASSAIDLVVDDEELATKVLRGMDGVLSVASSPAGGLVVDLDGVRRADVVAALVHSGVGVDAVTPRRRLEDAYLRLVDDEGL